MAVVDHTRAHVCILWIAEWDYGRCPLWCSNGRRRIVRAMSMDFHKVNVGGRWPWPSKFPARNHRLWRNRSPSIRPLPRRGRPRVYAAFATAKRIALVDRIELRRSVRARPSRLLVSGHIFPGDSRLYESLIIKYEEAYLGSSSVWMC